MRQRTAPARLGETHASSPRRARLRIAPFCDAIARWVRRIGEAGLSLTPKQSISRFGNQLIGNGSAIAARCLIAEKRRKRSISLCSYARAGVLTPPNAYNPGARINANRHARELKAKRPDAPKAAGPDFLLIFQHIREKTPTSTPSTLLNALLCFFFRRTAASEANHLFDSQMMQKNARKSARPQALPAQTLFFQGLSPAHGQKLPARLRAPSPKNAPYTTIARLFFCACDDKPTQARQRPKAC